MLTHWCLDTQCLHTRILQTEFGSHIVYILDHSYWFQRKSEQNFKIRTFYKSRWILLTLIFFHSVAAAGNNWFMLTKTCLNFYHTVSTKFFWNSKCSVPHSLKSGRMSCLSHCSPVKTLQQAHMYLTKLALRCFSGANDGFMLLCPHILASALLATGMHL